MGTHTSKVNNGYFSRQFSLFAKIDYDKLEIMDLTVDMIRRRYGIDSVMRAVFVKQSLDHLAGGISREKRDAGYTKLTID